MTKLVGKRKSAYLADIVRADAALDSSLGERLIGRLDSAIRSLRATKTQRAGVRGGPASWEIEPDAAPPAKSFDPYAFNAILVLKRQGREGLAGKLSEIGEVTQLRQIAEAQMIGLDQDMRSGPVDVEDLRAAVLKGVERLVANRRAAAS